MGNRAVVIAVLIGLGVFFWPQLKGKISPALGAQKDKPLGIKPIGSVMTHEEAVVTAAVTGGIAVWTSEKGHHIVKVGSQEYQDLFLGRPW